MAIRRTRDEWEEIVASYRKSGQTLRAFCKDHKINEKTLGNYTRAPVITEQETRSMEEWMSLLDEQKASGRPLAGWCREHGIREAAMRAAIRRRKTLQVTPSQWIEFTPCSAPTAIAEKREERIEIEAVCTGRETEAAAKKEEREEKSGQIRIRGSGLEIEVDAGYPVEKLAVLIGKLVK